MADQIFTYEKPTGEKTCVAGFRIFKRQERTLDENYKGNISAIVRFLLDKFLYDSSLQEEFTNKHVEKPK